LFIHRTESADAILSVSLFRNRLFTAANLSLFFLTLTQSAVSVLIPFYLQNLMGFHADTDGLDLDRRLGGDHRVGPGRRPTSDRFGSPPTVHGRRRDHDGRTIFIGSLTLRSTIFQMIMPQILIGLGWALFNSPNQSAIMSTVPRDKVGAASGMTLTTGRIGGAMGSLFPAR
jgi:hypothetical protein